MWGDNLSVEVLQHLGCNSSGDVVNEDTLMTYGSSGWFNETYPCAGSLKIYFIYRFYRKFLSETKNI